MVKYPFEADAVAAITLHRVTTRPPAWLPDATRRAVDIEGGALFGLYRGFSPTGPDYVTHFAALLSDGRRPQVLDLRTYAVQQRAPSTLSR